MLWQPSQYVYNGSGYNYVPGYWDYPLEDRGVLYAPVTFAQPYWRTPGWAYTPQYALGLGYGSGWGGGGLFGSLFIGPGYNNFYYGNYYNPWYWGGLGFGGFGFGWGGYGYFPWWYTGRGYYNPLWHHYRWLNRGNQGWAAGARNWNHNGSWGISPYRGNSGRAFAAVGGSGTGAVHPGGIVQPANQVVRAQQLARPISSFSHTAMYPGYTHSQAGFVNPGYQIHNPGYSYVHPGTGYYHTAPAYHVAPAYHGGFSGGYHGGGGGYHGGGGHGGGGHGGGHR
jgi:hypothetical protein